MCATGTHVFKNLAILVPICLPQFASAGFASTPLRAAAAIVTTLSEFIIITQPLGDLGVYVVHIYHHPIPGQHLGAAPYSRWSLFWDGGGADGGT
ncbi:unnamed protein product [Ceratitis capitata]|uniref:(Mediterranean fruit fly) hypothetical protein n=1 Tax=Ceratitis capitata TaxID=7213 RepID=A0A811VH13_CERCA|nr:unnamed protein product [Ceratitis capitata]